MNKKFRNEALEAAVHGSGQVCWESPANIALVKYWGKFPGQLPMNASIGFALGKSVVRIRMDYFMAPDTAFRLNDFLFNGQVNSGFEERIGKYLESLFPFFPFLRRMELSVKSESTFPHSAGIASSAAAFSALALCLCSIERGLRIVEKEPDSENNHRGEIPQMDPAFFAKASFMARLGSGSACRSLEGGFVVWGKNPELPGSSDELAIRLSDDQVNPKFYSLRDAILIMDDSPKKVSSSAGHALMHNHAYREGRKAQAAANMGDMLAALRTGDEKMFFRVLENEALSLHSLMMSSDPGYILLKPPTLLALEKIIQFREKSGLSLGFTMDAGPNIHLIYFERDAEQVKTFIMKELFVLCKDQRWIDDIMGPGPSRINPC